MRRWLDNASIRWKITVLTAGTSLMTLLVAAVAFGAGGVVSFRRSLEQKLGVVADMIGRNCTAALAFGDKSVATDVLGALDAEPSIVAAAVFDRDGRLFAAYVSDRSPGRVPASAAGLSSGGLARLRVVHPIVLDGDIVGTVYLESSLSEVVTRLEMLAALTFAIIVICGVAALFASSRLQRWISTPILDLAGIARRVTSGRDFSLRATAGARDEVGVLVQDFNRMLEEFEQQDLRLRQQQESLTEEVASRTAELVETNRQLTASVQRVEHYAEQIGQLTALGQLLQSCLSDDEVFNVLQDAMPRLFPGDSGAVTILKSSGNVMEAMAVWGDAPPRHRVFEPEACWAFRRGRPHFVASPDSPLRCAHLTADDGPATFCVPMMAQGDNVGIVQFNFHQQVNALDVTDESGFVQSTRGRIASALAEHAALSLANLRLRTALRSQSIVDALTGLYNRRYLETVLERDCRRAMRADRPLTVLMLDVDHFKQYNDTWGHEGGDIVLRELAMLLRTHFRGDDIACRFGGEEFVVVLADTSADVAFARAEELRTEVRRLSAEYRKQPLGSISVSIGVATLPDNGTTPDDLIGAADRALYDAKKAGRDRTACAQEVAPAVRLAE